LEAIRKNSINCRILSIGSSEEYGGVDAKCLPLIETHPVNPLSPYAVARVSQELMSKVYVDSLQLDIVLTRSFNHFGPRQKDVFVIPTFIKQVCQTKLEGNSCVILHTGDVDVVRDFLDVRDVIHAYYALFERGKSGELYNVCSGNGISLRDLIKKIGEQNMIDIQVVVENDKIRPNDNRRIIGSNEKICAATAWSPSITLEQSLCDISEYWMKQLKHEKETRK
jgi:GDP-4-dehydro-6-deoxy-D-mannose reductase